MNEQDADARASDLNRALGAQGADEVFYVPVERAPGEWDVEKRVQRKSWLRKLWDALLTAPGP